MTPTPEPPKRKTKNYWSYWILIGVAAGWFGVFTHLSPFYGFGLGVMTSVIFMNWKHIIGEDNDHT
jgi:hypothetical protein